jgi:hypothetical protein
VSGIVRDFPAMLLDIRARRLKVTERRFACREMQRHQPAGRIVDIHQQRAGRRTVLEPAVIAAIDLHQFAETCAPGASARHPETHVHHQPTNHFLRQPDAVTFPELLARQRRPEIGIALTHQP